MVTDEIDNPHGDTDNPDKVAEYFEVKDSLRTFRADLRDAKDQHHVREELKRVEEKVKLLRQQIANSEEIVAIKSKVDSLKERMDLLKEIIKVELIEKEEEEVKKDGRKLKIVKVLKEMKDEEAL